MNTNANNSAASTDANSANVQPATACVTNKRKAQNVAITTVKVITYPVNLALKTAADLVNITQATAIKAIDGTPLLESMQACDTWTATQQAKVITKGMQARQKLLDMKQANREREIKAIEKTLAELKNAPVVKATLPEPKTEKEVFIPINKRKANLTVVPDAVSASVPAAVPPAPIELPKMSAALAQ